MFTVIFTQKYRKMESEEDFHNLEKKHTRGGEKKKTALFSFGSTEKLNPNQCDLAYPSIVVINYLTEETVKEAEICCAIKLKITET